MTLLARLDVYGDPAPQGSKSAVVRGGRAVVIEGKGTTGRNRHKAWRAIVELEAHAWQLEHRRGGAPFDGPLAVRVDFYLRRPPSVTTTARPRPTVKPDVDKLARSVLDALTAGHLLTDDARVVDLYTCKHYADDRRPGAEIRIGRAEELIG